MKFVQRIFVYITVFTVLLLSVSVVGQCADYDCVSEDGVISFFTEDDYNAWAAENGVTTTVPASPSRGGFFSAAASTPSYPPTWLPNWYASTWVFTSTYPSFDTLKSLFASEYNSSVRPATPKVASDFKDDSIFILGFKKSNNYMYFIVGYDPLNTCVGLNYTAGTLNVRVGSKYPVIYWAVDVSTGSFIKMSGVYGYAPSIFYSSSNEHVESFTGTLGEGTYTTVNMAYNYWYKSYNLADVSASSNIVCNFNTTAFKIWEGSSSTVSQGTVGYQKCGVSPYPTPDGYSEQAAEERNNKVGSWISSLGDRISGFFSSLANSISGFFTTLKNWLLWFNADGAASYSNPFDSVFSSVQESIDDSIDNLSDFKAQLNFSSDDPDNPYKKVYDSVSSGSGALSRIFTAVPIFTAFLTFFVVFAVIRKVVGR